MTLTDFLLARIAEDEAVARALDWVPPLVTDGSLPSVAPTLTAHIARHTPARVLAECEAKRRIVEACLDPVGEVELGPTKSVLCILATVYADHPGFREEWRP